jgi:hypothetical protein
MSCAAAIKSSYVLKEVTIMAAKKKAKKPAKKAAKKKRA